MNESTEAPVKVGETYDVSINALGEKGDGIARVRGFVLFVQGVKKGDYVKIRISKVLKNVGFAELVEKLERPAHEPKYATMTSEEFRREEIREEQYEDTENFGEEE